MLNTDKKFLITDDNDLFSLLDIDSKNQNTPLFKPGPYWVKYSQRISHETARSGLANFRNNINIGKGFADVISADPFLLIRNNYSLKERLIRLFLKLPLIRSHIVKTYLATSRSLLEFMKRFRSDFYSLLFKELFDSLIAKLGIIDPLVGNPNNIVMINGQKIGMSYLYASLRLSSFSETIDFNKCYTYFEIGGGFGSTTELMLRMYPNVKKVIYLDIPPNLYIGTQYLKSIFGSAVSDYRLLKNEKEISFKKGKEELEILAIPPWLIDRVTANIDLFYNSESFQEMTPQIVNYYAAHINRLFGVNKKRICLWFYEHTDVTNTLPPNEVISILESNLNVPLIKFLPKYSLKDNAVWIYGNEN
jgi:putative sugar O-methyltransferase